MASLIRSAEAVGETGDWDWPALSFGVTPDASWAISDRLIVFIPGLVDVVRNVSSTCQRPDSEILG
jgi:hypothetical protein